MSPQAQEHPKSPSIPPHGEGTRGRHKPRHPQGRNEGEKVQGDTQHPPPAPQAPLSLPSAPHSEDRPRYQPNTNTGKPQGRERWGRPQDGGAAPPQGRESGRDSPRGSTRRCRCLCAFSRWVWHTGQQFQPWERLKITIWARRGGCEWRSQGEGAGPSGSSRSGSAAGAISLPGIRV